MERLEVSVMLKGMEYRMMETIQSEIESIKKDTENAVKKAISDFDFDDTIKDIIHEWLDEQIKDMSINLLDSELMNVEPELSRLVKNTIKTALEEK
jgi:ribosomal protein S3AE